MVSSCGTLTDLVFVKHHSLYVFPSKLYFQLSKIVTFVVVFHHPEKNTCDQLPRFCRVLVKVSFKWLKPRPVGDLTNYCDFPQNKYVKLIFIITEFIENIYCIRGGANLFWWDQKCLGKLYNARVKFLVDIIARRKVRVEFRLSQVHFSCASSTVISTSKYHYLPRKMWTFW